ncbi:MAG: DEAD/DEAH box helicase [Bacteroidales bacterium]|jgi:SNF2 family DNA or RNA helicase|nr:DEAD/DEAH box helicase [Bacteroidales bacterium]
MELLEQQNSAIEKLRRFKVGALFMEAGTGKTRVACELINSVPSIDLVIWLGPLNTIRPKTGIASIKDEVNKWGGFTAPVVYVGIESIQRSNVKYLHLLNTIKDASTPFVIIDESLKIKNADAKGTKRLIEVGKMVEYKLILNGTPLSKNLLDLWSQMEFLSHKILNMSHSEFKNTFCEYTKITKDFGFKSYTKEFITGYENVDYLYSLIRHYVYECNLSINIKQYYRILNYSLDEKSRAEYFRIKTNYLDDMTLLWKNNNIFLEMTQKMQHVYCCTEEKFETLTALFQHIDESRTIIFCKFTDSLAACEKRFPKATVLSYQKESFGLNLQHLSHTIYFDKNWDYALRIQSGRRTYRVGQESNCHYWDLTGNVGLETLIDTNIQKKITMIEYFKEKTKKELYEVL